MIKGKIRMTLDSPFSSCGSCKMYSNVSSLTVNFGVTRLNASSGISTGTPCCSMSCLIVWISLGDRILLLVTKALDSKMASWMFVRMVLVLRSGWPTIMNTGNSAGLRAADTITGAPASRNGRWDENTGNLWPWRPLNRALKCLPPLGGLQTPNVII